MSEELFWLIVCVYNEARGESEEGQIAVAHVILNRAEQRNKPIKRIVLQPYQFSWANGNKRPPIKDYNAFIQCINSVNKCLLQRESGEKFYNCTHYFGDYIPQPIWAKDMKTIKHIGRHIFVK